MVMATLKKQLLVTTTNKVGEFAAITAVLSAAKVSLTGICAWAEGEKAMFALLTDSVDTAKNALTAKGYQTTEEDVITVMLEDKVGAAAAIAKKIKDAGINLDYVYGAVCGCKDTKALLVIGSKEKSGIIAALNA
jgi:hypothetical protein